MGFNNPPENAKEICPEFIWSTTNFKEIKWQVCELLINVHLLSLTWGSRSSWSALCYTPLPTKSCPSNQEHRRASLGDWKHWYREMFCMVGEYRSQHDKVVTYSMGVRTSQEVSSHRNLLVGCMLALRYLPMCLRPHKGLAMPGIFNKWKELNRP